MLHLGLSVKLKCFGKDWGIGCPWHRLVNGRLSHRSDRLRIESDKASASHVASHTAMFLMSCFSHLQND